MSTCEALEKVDEAIEHTPTLVELYSCKARIYKHVLSPSLPAVKDGFMSFFGGTGIF